MFITVAIITLLIWSWSANYARSQNKFLKKRDNGDFKILFGINSIATTVALTLWLFVNSTMGVANVFVSLAILLIVMFILSNAMRIWLTSTTFSVNGKTSINSLKFVLIEEIVIYSLIIFISLKMGGAW